MFPLRLLILCISLLSIHSTFALTNSAQSAFLNLERLLQNKTPVPFSRVKAFESYPLYPHLLNAFYQTHMDSVDEEALTLFKTHFHDSPAHLKLEESWLIKQAKRGEWDAFFRVFNTYPKPSVELRCMEMQGQFALSHSTAWANDFMQIWNVQQALPASCHTAAHILEHEQKLSTTQKWQRVRFLLRHDSQKEAKVLVKTLPQSYQSAFRFYQMHQQHPKKLFSNLSLLNHSESFNEIAIEMVLYRIRQNYEQGKSLWNQLSKVAHFSSGEKNEVQKALALKAARSHISEARDLFRDVTLHTEDVTHHEWRALSSMRAQAWREALHHIHAMPITLKNESKWQYWRARSLEAVGEQAEATPIFEKLCKDESYYGFLSCQRIEFTPTIQVKMTELDKQLFDKIQHSPFVKRVQEWKAMQRHIKAVHEWEFAISQLSQKELTIAAKVAAHNNWHDLAIRTANLAQQSSDIPLRFPTPHRSLMVQLANEHQLDPSILYSLTRQESLFVHEARSGVGARGLMQLMPKTAKEVAKQAHVRMGALEDLNRPEINLRLGSHYLKTLMQRLQNPVLAAAAYNAGPNRIRKWLPNHPMDADVWIESIPFDETRTYVKNIMTYSVIYDHVLSQDNQFKKRMKQVG